jgi:four helix bundle protein
MSTSPNVYTQRGNRNRSYMRLEVWQDAMRVFEVVCRIVRNEAKVDWKLRGQIVDAAQSVSSNIAEGYGRRGLPEYIQYCYIARGSMGETLTRAIGLKTSQQITAAQFEEIDAVHYETENKLERLIESLEKKRDTGDWSSTLREDSPHDILPNSPIVHQSNSPSLT